MDQGSEPADLFEDFEIKQKVSVVWEKVFTASNRVLTHANSFGFLGMEIIPSPNIHQMLVTLQIFTAFIEILIGSNLDYDETRLLINAKEQITRMERVAAALKANNREDFEIALAALNGQAAF